MKRLQNRIAESGLTLPVMSVYGLGVWMASGLVSHGWWPQLACFVLSVYLMAEMNNAFSLLRVRSRMVSGVFIALMCTMTFTFASLECSLLQLLAIAALLLLLSTYQDKQALGRIYYSFLILGLASLTFVQVLWLVPLLWLLTGTQLQAQSWRGLLASLTGLATPYWFLCVWFIYQRDFTPLTDHFAGVGSFAPLHYDLAAIGLGRLLPFVLIAVLTVTGIVHFWRNSIDEKIRIRLLYGLFAWLTLAVLLVVALQPQHYDPLMRLAVITASPLIAHFLTLTSSKITNIAFFAIAAITLAVTIINLIHCASL